MHLTLDPSTANTCYRETTTNANSIAARKTCDSWFMQAHNLLLKQNFHFVVFGSTLSCSCRHGAFCFFRRTHRSIRVSWTQWSGGLHVSMSTPDFGIRQARVTKDRIREIYKIIIMALFHPKVTSGIMFLLPIDRPPARNERSLDFQNVRFYHRRLGQQKCTLHTTLGDVRKCIFVPVKALNFEPSSTSINWNHSNNKTKF